MKLKTLLATGIIGLSALSVSADTLYGIYINVGAGQGALSGDANYDGADNAFKMDEDKNTVTFGTVKLEHPIPLIPNFRVAAETYDFTNPSTASGFEFGGVTYNEVFTTGMKGTETTGTLYYEILDNWVSVDVGVSVKNVDMDLVFTGESMPNTMENLSIWVPMAYGSVEFAIPATGVIIGGEVETLALNDNEFTLTDFYVGYEVIDLVAVDATMKLGYKNRQVILDDVDGFNMDLSGETVYGSVQFHF